MLIHFDCRYYQTDRPCQPHKDSGVKCEGCRHYDPVRSSILLIKLAARGDVLRTTALLPALRDRYPGCRLTWLVSRKSADVLASLSSIDRLWIFDVDTLAALQVEKFDWVINLDLSPESLALATLAQGVEKSGFGLTPQGAAVCWNPEAEPYLAMSYWDDLKKANTRTYQQLMLDIIGSKVSAGEILVEPPESERFYARQFFERHQMDFARPVIGLNLGAAGRWRWKRWTSEGFRELAEMLHNRLGAQLLILSGPDEPELKEAWLKQCPVPCVDGGHDNSFARFSALVERCDLVVTGDTLALHVALGLGRKVVALFGPTSKNEVDLYGRGVALSGEVPCLCCYLPDCRVRPSCMESLSSAAVFEAVVNLLERKEPSS